MFEGLQTGIQSALKALRGKGKLSEGNMRDALALVEQALLEADVSYSVVQDFMARVTERSLGTKVLLSLDPSQQVMGIVFEELVNVLGPVDPSLHLRGDVTTIMMCGLQGSGKTTTCGKLVRLIQSEGRKALMVAADLQRPAAIEQLHVLGEQIGCQVYSEQGATDPIKVCRNAVAEAKKQNINVVLLDTAGRLAIDEELMNQLREIDRRVQPDQAFLVVDGMTGQDAVNSAKAFNEALELDGVVMTKLDGDARGGALLSVKHVTGVPIKFIGTGEQLDSLEPFYPDRMASRILGGGDIQTMIETAQREFDQDEMLKAEERLKSGVFTLDDFRKQMMQVARPGLMQKMMGMMPGMGEMSKMMEDEDTEQSVKRLIGIIDSMTPDERTNPKLIDPSRRQRIANGSGTQANEVNDLVKQFDGMKSVMEQMAGKGMRERMKMVNDLQKGGMLNPGGRIAKQKKGTGKRLTTKERDQRQKALKKSRRKKPKKGKRR
jgi:signal recognition particle subunit SRP54